METTLKGLVVASLLVAPIAYSKPNPDLWEGIKDRFYGEDTVMIMAEDSVLDINTPRRAMSGAQVPLDLSWNNENFVEVAVYVNGNPTQEAFTFKLTDMSTDVDVKTRIRVEQDTFIHAVAKDKDGNYHMAVTSVRAAGGCTAYTDFNNPMLLKDLGKIKTKLSLGKFTTRIKHVQYTGLQRHFDGAGTIPRYVVENVTWSVDGQVVIEADTDISVAMNPYFRFNIPYEMDVEFVDTRGNIYNNFKE